MNEIHNTISIGSSITDDVFEQFNVILQMFNGIWQKQEEIRKQRILDEENLYVTKYVKMIVYLNVIIKI